MRWLPLVALAGCAAPESAAPARGSAGSAVAVVPHDAGAEAVGAPSDAAPQAWTISTSSVLASAPVTGSVVTSTHGAPISVIAVSEDGSVAVSSDGHSVRLWPSLDGKHEPVVVAMRTALGLAVARDGDAVVIAGLDAIGQLELVRTSADGAPLSRVDIASPRPIRAVFATSTVLLALRDDGGIAQYEFSGAFGGALPPTPREHVRTLAVRSDGVLAVIEGGGKVHGQWVEFNGVGLQWGESVGTLPNGGPDVVLSPDHRRIGMVVRNSVLKLDLATGAVVERYRNDDGFSKLHVIGFVDSTSLAFDKSGLLGELDGAYEPEWRENNVAATTFAISDHTVVGADSALLILAKKGEAAKFLGYQTMGLVDIVPHGTGFLASNYSTIVDLGPDFRARRTLELGTHSGLLQNPLFVDGDHVVTAFAYGYENPQGVFFADIKTGEVVPLGDGYASYNANAGLLVLNRNKELGILRYDRKKHEFGDEMTLPVAQNAQIVWLAPARGDFAVATVNGDATNVALDIVRVRDKPEIVKTKTVVPDEEWFRSQDVTTLLDDSWKPSQTRPSPDHSLVAEVRDGRMTLREAAGAERWVVAATGIADVTWTAKGELVAYGDGMARVDLATGALRERQCGWRFGLWEERPMSFTAFSNSATLCEAP